MTIQVSELILVPDVQICDDTLSALNYRGHGHLGPYDNESKSLKELSEVVRDTISFHTSEPSLSGLNTTRGIEGEGEGLKIYPWNMDETEYDDDDEDDDYDDGGRWVHKDEYMWDCDDEEEYDEDEDENEEGEYDEDEPDEYRGHGGHGQDVEDALKGRRLGTPPSNDREGTGVLIKQSQQGPHARLQNDTGYLVQVDLLPHPIIEGPPGTVTRVLRVPTRMTFQKLAESINKAYDWTGLHAYEFKLCKPCRKRIRCMCELCEPMVAMFSKPISGVAHVDEGTCRFFTRFYADKVALSDVWEHEACRRLSLSYRYDFGMNREHLVHFLGEADGRLGSAMALPDDQEIWCLSGEGHPGSEYVRESWPKCSYEWDREAVNKELRKLTI